MAAINGNKNKFGVEKEDKGLYLFLTESKAFQLG